MLNLLFSKDKWNIISFLNFNNADGKNIHPGF